MVGWFKKKIEQNSLVDMCSRIKRLEAAVSAIVLHFPESTSGAMPADDKLDQLVIEYKQRLDDLERRFSALYLRIECRFSKLKKESKFKVFEEKIGKELGSLKGQIATMTMTVIRKEIIKFKARERARANRQQNLKKKGELAA